MSNSLFAATIAATIGVVVEELCNNTVLTHPSLNRQMGLKQRCSMRKLHLDIK